MTLHPDKLKEPLRWRKPRRVFVNSMSDLFHEEVPDEFVAEVFGVMANADCHIFQVLTKRPERMRELLSDLDWWADVRYFAANAAIEVGSSPERPYLTVTQLDRIAADQLLPNVWLGVSIENRRFVHRADLLRETPAAVRFISAEPLLGPLISRLPCPNGPDCDLCEYEGGYGDIVGGEPWSLNLDGIDWLIVGGESGPHHRPCHSSWVRDLRDATLDNGTAFFFKQWGGRTTKSGGRELDGRTWDQFPLIDDWLEQQPIHGTLL